MIKEVIAKIVVKKKSKNKTYLIKDKEAYIVAKSEICCSHGLPRDKTSLTNELQQVLHYVGKKSISNKIKSKSAQIYLR